jgi:hypothetical protein
MSGMTRSPDEDLAALAASQHGVFATRHVTELGFTDDERQGRLDSGRWDLLYDGVYRMGGAPRTWRGDVLAACLAAPAMGAASHCSAASLAGLPSGRTDTVEIICERWRRTRNDGLVVHESLVLAPEDLDEIERIPCTSVARTLFDLARKLTVVMLDANIDSALRRDLVTVAELQSAAARLATKGRPGGRRFRAAVEARSVASALPESVPERLLAAMLVRQGLPSPVHQFVVRDELGGFVARVDLAYPEWMIVIEYDSVEHHTGTTAHIRDSARRDAIGDRHYVVLTATVADLRDRGERLAGLVKRRRARMT